MLGKESGFCEIFHTVVQRFGKSLDEGAAAGGTCLVELDTVYRLVLNLDTFHVLTADIKNTVNLRIEESSRIVVRYGFHFAVVQQKGGFHQCFAVAGRAGTDNFSGLWEKRMYFLQGTDGSL